MTVIEERRDNFLISTDQTRLDVATIHDFLSNEAYWSSGRSVATVQRAIEHSLCFGVYDGEQQVGFCRVVTDYATFGWLCDVFVLPSHRGLGLSKWLVACVVAHPDLQGMKRMVLVTRDAHELYHQYGGFERSAEFERWMIRAMR